MVHIAVERGKREGEDTPYEWLVEDGNVVRHRDQAASASLVVRPRFQEIKETWQAMNFCFVEDVDEEARKDRDGEDGMVRCSAPW
jgi:hypothetical protein